MNAVKRSTATIKMGHNAGRSVAIIGGGIGGLMAALAFTQQGAQVTVFEQADALTEVGAGLQITPNGARALNALGLGDDLAKAGITAQAVMPMDAISGQAITQFDLSRQMPAYRFYHRATLIDILAQACVKAGVDVQLATQVSNVTGDGCFYANGQHIAPSLTIGADGLHSVVRDHLNAKAPPFFTGQVAWRAVIPYPHADPIARIWMAPGRHVVTYPLPGDRLNIVAIQARDHWVQEGWHHKDNADNLRSAFADCDRSIGDILTQVTDVNLWGLFRHPVAAHWHKGSVAILGDAAHPTLPFLAQGANLAIEDAYVLARSCNENAQLHSALGHYQMLRRNRVVRAIDTANRNARHYHLTGVSRKIAHIGLRAMGAVAPSAFIGRLGWLYDHDVTA